MEFFFLTHRHLLNLLCMTVRDDFYMFSFRRRAAVFLFPRPAFVCLFVFFLLSEFQLATALPPPFISPLF